MLLWIVYEVLSAEFYSGDTQANLEKTLWQNFAYPRSPSLSDGLLCLMPNEGASA